MFQHISCPEGWHPDGMAAAAPSSPLSCPQGATSPSLPFALHMQQQRSTFPETGRGALLALLGLCMATTIVPAIRGYYLVPVAVLLAMAALVLALEYFQRQPVPSETIEFSFDQLRIRNHRGNMIALPSYWTRIEEVRPNPYNLRLILICRGRSIEVGRCLTMEERAEVSRIIRSALCQMRGGNG